MKTLTIRQELLILREYQKKTGTGQRVTQAALDGWVREKRKLHVVSNQSTISRTLKDRKRLEDMSLSKGMTLNWSRSQVAPSHEDALYR